MNHAQMTFDVDAVLHADFAETLGGDVRSVKDVLLDFVCAYVGQALELVLCTLKADRLASCSRNLEAVFADLVVQPSRRSYRRWGRFCRDGSNPVRRRESSGAKSGWGRSSHANQRHSAHFVGSRHCGSPCTPVATTKRVM
jgi:hypothetical protein